MPLTLKQVRDVCLEGSSDQCRFLSEDSTGKFYCLKLTGKKDLIDKEVLDFKKRQKAKNVDPASLGYPLGDNCKGYMFFRNLLQGYDVP